VVEIGHAGIEREQQPRTRQRHRQILNAHDSIVRARP
jgi:hypothetical protein